MKSASGSTKREAKAPKSSSLEGGPTRRRPSSEPLTNARRLWRSLRASWPPRPSHAQRTNCELSPSSFRRSFRTCIRCSRLTLRRYSGVPSPKPRSRSIPPKQTPRPYYMVKGQCGSHRAGLFVFLPSSSRISDPPLQRCLASSKCESGPIAGERRRENLKFFVSRIAPHGLRKTLSCSFLPSPLTLLHLLLKSRAHGERRYP